MINAWQATLTTTAEEVVPSEGIDGRHPRIVYLSTASAAIRLGGDSNVDATDGYPFDDSSSPLSLLLQPGDSLWMVAESGTPTVQVMVTRSDAASE